jgi:DNA-binding NarL/FixJ family response regulator
VKKTTILLVDDHMVVREGLRALLATEPDLEVVGEAETGRQAVDLARQLRPNLVVMDIVMPSLNGLEATRQITKNAPSCKVLILSSYSDDEYVQRLTEVGATGYLIKHTAADELLNAIREIEKGNTVYSPAIARQLRDHHAGKPAQRNDHLTGREAEVLQLVAEGQPSKQIASELGINIKTVEKHRQQVMNKLSIHDVAGLTRYAIAKGIIKSGAEVKLN